MQLKTSSSQSTIQCYSIPEYGHAIPLLRVADIIQTQLPYTRVSFHTSSYWIDKMKNQWSHVNMVGINDGVTSDKHFQTMRQGPTVLTDYLFIMHREYFKNKKNKPDLMICDLFEGEAIQYAVNNNIKLIVNCIMPYAFMQHHFSFPTFRRAFPLAGLTIMKPPSLPLSLQKIFADQHSTFRHKARIFVNSAFGLEQPTIVPPHHTLTGLLANRSTRKAEVDQQLKGWMKSWKKKGKKKFLYISFGSFLNISEQLALTILKSIEIAGYPAIWSLSGSLGHQIDTRLIFHKPWLPQEAILSMPEVCAYISHCGWGSTGEAVVSETPLICIPGFGDQIYNAELVHAKQIGLQIYNPPILTPEPIFNPKISSQTISSAITEVMTNELYQKNMAVVNGICGTYRTERIVSETVSDTLNYGYQHLIDQGFQEATKRTRASNIKLSFLLFAVFILFMILGRKSK